MTYWRPNTIFESFTACRFARRGMCWKSPLQTRKMAGHRMAFSYSCWDLSQTGDVFCTSQFFATVFCNFHGRTRLSAQSARHQSELGAHIPQIDGLQHILCSTSTIKSPARRLEISVNTSRIYLVSWDIVNYQMSIWATSSFLLVFKYATVRRST